MEEHKEKASNFIENLDYNCITYTSRKDWSQLLGHYSWDCVVISRLITKILKFLNLISNCHKIQHTQEFCHQICHALEDWHLKPPEVIKPHKENIYTNHLLDFSLNFVLEVLHLQWVRFWGNKWDSLKPHSTSHTLEIGNLPKMVKLELRGWWIGSQQKKHEKNKSYIK